MDSEELPVINRLVNTTRGHKLQNLRSYRYDSPLVSVKFENLPDRFDLLYDCDDEELDFTNGGGAGVPGLLVASMSVVDEWRL